MGSGASASKDAPHLAEYYELLKKETEESTEDPAALGMEMLMGGNDAIKKIQKKMADWYEEKGKPKLTESFQHHDKDKSGVLENKEAKVFFLNLIQNTETFALALAQSVGKKQVEMTSQMMGEMMGGPKEVKKIEKQMTAQLKMAMAAQKKDLDQRVKDYKKNKDERDEAAFKVLDTSEDGKIQLVEFLAAFAPDAPKQAELMVALGFMTEQEKLMQEQMKQMMEMMGGEKKPKKEKKEGEEGEEDEEDDMEGGCPQQ